MAYRKESLNKKEREMKGLENVILILLEDKWKS